MTVDLLSTVDLRLMEDPLSMQDRALMAGRVWMADPLSTVDPLLMPDEQTWDRQMEDRFRTFRRTCSMPATTRGASQSPATGIPT